MICLKIRTFVVSATTWALASHRNYLLWFAWKFVPLWYQQQHYFIKSIFARGCDLLENSYLCGISNNDSAKWNSKRAVVICLKIRTFVVSATTTEYKLHDALCCDLLENSYLCGISNNGTLPLHVYHFVVICLKIRTFVVSATTTYQYFHNSL